MRKIIGSDDALQDFDSANFHLAQGSPQAATPIAGRIESGVDLLAEMPVGHPGRIKCACENLVLKASYMVAYALSDRAVTALRLIHESRDWARIGRKGRGRSGDAPYFGWHHMMLL